MKIKISDITEWASHNGIPANGDLFEGEYKGKTYRAEYYGEVRPGSNFVEVLMAADSKIEVLIDGRWEVVDTSQMTDDEFNELVASITPVLESREFYY